MNKKDIKICFVSSSGGHWEELMCLKPIMNEYHSIFITEKGGQVEDSKLKNIYVFPQINRKENGFLFHLGKVFIKARKILKAERPDYLITTGALISYPFCLIGKLMGIKVIFIESFARVYNKSLTGKLVYPIADLFLVQWESMLKCYPKAKYVGGIF